MKYVIMCCGGFPVLDGNRVNLCDFPDELQDSDFFSSVERARERVLALRRDKNYKDEDFSIMKIHDFDAIMDEDLSELEEVKVCRPKN
jgi:hypothetical protein